MYPTITDMLQDLFGLHVPLPIQTFGFFVAIAFLVSAYILNKEIQRKEKDGLMKPQQTTVITGNPASISEMITSGLLGFLLGFKLLFALLNYHSFVENPQEAILSLKGNWLGGLLVGIISVYIRYSEKNKTKKAIPQENKVIVYPHEQLGNIVFICAGAGLLGAKLFHNLENWDDFIADPIGALLSFSGLTMYGGLICTSIVLYFYCKKIGIRFIDLADCAAPALMIGYAIGRVGCHTSGDGDWGIVNTNPKPNWLSFAPDWLWKYNFPHNVVSEGVPIPDCVGRHCFILPEAVFPTSLYEAIFCTLLFVILWSVRKKIIKPGVLFFLYLLLNGMERLLIEQIRVNTKYHIFDNAITQAEIIATCLIIAGAIGIYIYNKKKFITPTLT